MTPYGITDFLIEGVLYLLVFVCFLSYAAYGFDLIYYYYKKIQAKNKDRTNKNNA